MGEIVTLEIPENAARSAREIARRTQRPVEEVLVDWIDKAAAGLPVEELSDEQILALCDSQLDMGQQAELSRLLALLEEIVKMTSELESIFEREVDLITDRALMRSKNWIRRNEIQKSAQVVSDQGRIVHEP